MQLLFKILNLFLTPQIRCIITNFSCYLIKFTHRSTIFRDGYSCLLDLQGSFLFFLDYIY